MFDVGSSGGYYTEKSPKLMLHEWCTQQKRPKPKYKAIAIDPERGGGFRCVLWGVGRRFLKPLVVVIGAGCLPHLSGSRFMDA
jgi:hypothetical protein